MSLKRARSDSLDEPNKCLKVDHIPPVRIRWSSPTLNELFTGDLIYSQSSLVRTFQSPLSVDTMEQEINITESFLRQQENSHPDRAIAKFERQNTLHQILLDSCFRI